MVRLTRRWQRPEPQEPPPGPRKQRSLTQRAADPDVRVRREVGYRSDCPPEALERLAADPDALTREAVAANSSASPEVLKRLAADPVAEVRTMVAVNPGVPQRTLATLAADPLETVRETLVDHTRSPRVLMAMTADPHQRIRDRVWARCWLDAWRVAQPAHAEILLGELMRRCDILERLADQQFLWWLPHPAIERLFKAGPVEMQQAAARLLADDTVAYTLPQELAVLAAHSDPITRLRVAQNPQTSVVCLAELAADRNFAVALAAVEHPDCPDDARRQALADPVLVARLAALQERRWRPAKHEQRLAQSLYSAESRWGRSLPEAVFVDAGDAQTFATTVLAVPLVQERYPHVRGHEPADVRLNRRLRTTNGRFHVERLLNGLRWEQAWMELRPAVATPGVLLHELAHLLVRSDPANIMLDPQPHAHGSEQATALLDLAEAGYGAESRSQLLGCYETFGVVSLTSPLPGSV